MNLKIFSFIFFLLFVGNSVVTAQSHRVKPENFFGIQFRPLIPLGMVGDRPFTIRNDNFETKISPAFGYSYGGTVRVGLTELLSIETGINLSQRKFKAEYSVADSSLYADHTIGYFSFDVPANLLIYIKLGEKFYMNVAGGASLNYNPSNIRKVLTPDEFAQDIFIFEGLRQRYFSFNANVEVGFEFRTYNAGIFYLGMYGRVPFGRVLEIATEYRYDTYSSVAYGEVKGATFALSLKYFFHNTRIKKGPQRQKGPTE